MADPVIHSFQIDPARIAKGAEAIGIVNASVADEEVTVMAEIPQPAGAPRITATTTLRIEGSVPRPVFTEVDASGNTVAEPKLNLAVDEAEPFKVRISVK